MNPRPTNSHSAYTHLADGRIGLRRLRAGDGLTVLCFPHAGGQSLGFRELAAQLGRGLAVYAIDPPGHGWASGPPSESIEEVVAMYRAHLPPALLGGVLLGHSMGGYVALTLAAALSAPAHAVVVGATRPPCRRTDYTALSELGDDALRATLDDPQSPHASLFEQFRDLVRADLRAFDRYTAPGAPLRSPLLAVGGLDDPLCRAEHMFDWRDHAADATVDFLAGGHFFVQSNARAYALSIQRFLAMLDIRRDCHR